MDKGNQKQHFQIKVKEGIPNIDVLIMEQFSTKTITLKQNYFFEFNRYERCFDRLWVTGSFGLYKRYQFSIRVLPV